MRKMIAAMLSLVMMGSLAACGTKKGTEKNDSAVKKTVGIAMPSDKLERWNSDGDYLRSLFEKAGYEVKLIYSDNDPTRQNNDILSMLNEGVDLLLIAAVDSSTLTKSLEEAKGKEIPVVAYDRLIMNTNAVTYYVSFDNNVVGRLQGEFVRDALDLENAKGPFNIEFISGDSADNNARFFFNGAYGALKKYIDSGKLVSPSGKTTFESTATKDWSTENAKTEMTKRLSAYFSGAKLDAVLCANDSTALGAEEAIESSYKLKNVPVITGQDGDNENLKKLVDGKQSMTVFKNVRDEASVAFEVCKRLLNDEVPTGKLVESLAVDVTYDSESYNNGVKYVQSYLLVPTVITKDNLQIMVNTGLYQWDAENKYIESVKKQ